MFKTLFFTTLLGLSASLGAAVDLRYFTGSTLLLEDGATSILFDPAFTRPGILHWLNLSDFRSDELLVARVLKENKIDRLDAVFASHSHFDHVIDAPLVSRLAKATFYTDPSSEIIAKAHGDPKIVTRPVRDGEPVTLGAFRVTPLLREHSKILHVYPFLPGPVPEDFDFGFYDYKVGQTWFYLIEHPLGTILLDQAAEMNLEKLGGRVGEVHVLIQGISNRKGDESVLDGYAKHLKPRIYVPNHFDNFFFAFDPKTETRLPFLGMEELLRKLRGAYPKLEVVVPRYGERIRLLK